MWFFLISDGDGLSDAQDTLAHHPPTVADSGMSGLAMVNGGFELPHYMNVSANYPVAGSIPGWHTTDTSFEFWTNGFRGVALYEGIQFVELNAFAEGMLAHDWDGLDTPCPVPPEDSSTPDADSPDADSPETGDSPNLMPECDSAEPEWAVHGGWSCTTTAQGIMGVIWAAVIFSVLCLMSLFRRGR